MERAELHIDNYYASEIDPFAIQIAQANYPNTKQLGDVKHLEVNKLPPIDILMGGSPCQGFSFSGKRLNFDDPRSQLFFEYAKILKIIQPAYFLLENVRMKRESQDIISNYLGVEPIEINSSLVSGQHRKRLYWTNIPFYAQPPDKDIHLKDILQTNIPDFNINKLLHTDKAVRYMNRQVKGGRTHWDFKHHSDSNNPKSSAVVANFFKGVPYNVLKDGECIRKFHPVECERLQTLPDNYTSMVSNTQRYKSIGNGWTVDVIAHILQGVEK